jgi:hypothetical protein
MRARGLMTAAALLLAGCGDPASKKCGFVGDRALPPEAVIIVTDGLSNVAADVADGDRVPLVRPPQGGQVTYAAARVRNLSTCGLQFRAYYRNPDNGNEIAFDGRSATVHVDSDGWARPDPSELSEFANIPPCPDHDPDRDVHDTPTVLEMTVIHDDGPPLIVRATVVPTCTGADGQAQALCECECSRPPPGGQHMCNNGILDGGTSD